MEVTERRRYVCMYVCTAILMHGTEVKEEQGFGCIQHSYTPYCLCLWTDWGYAVFSTCMSYSFMDLIESDVGVPGCL